MVTGFIDSHCHLDFACFDADREQILHRCQQANIHTLVVPGTQAKDWAKQLNLAKTYQSIRFALGLHPYFLASFAETHLSQLSDLLQNNIKQVVALGEIGLDAAIAVNWQLQQNVFIQQLNLAKDLQLPIILHHRRTHNQLIRIIKQLDFRHGGIVHAFSGSVQEAHTYLDLGFKLGVGGLITYERAVKTKKTIAQLPLNSLVLETDAPDMPIQGKQGQRNSPEYIPLIFETLLGLRSETAEALQAALVKNVQQCLGNLT